MRRQSEAATALWMEGNIVQQGAQAKRRRRSALPHSKLVRWLHRLCPDGDPLIAQNQQATRLAERHA